MIHYLTSRLLSRRYKTTVMKKQETQQHIEDGAFKTTVVYMTEAGCAATHANDKPGDENFCSQAVGDKLIKLGYATAEKPKGKKEDKV